MDEPIWKSFSTNERSISLAVALTEKLPLSRIPLQNVILGGVKPVSNDHQHCLWSCSHGHQYHHGVAGSSGLAFMARTLLPAANYLSRSSFPRNSYCKRQYSYGFQTLSLACGPVSQRARDMGRLEKGSSKVISLPAYQRREHRSLGGSFRNP